MDLFAAGLYRLIRQTQDMSEQLIQAIWLILARLESQIEIFPVYDLEPPLAAVSELIRLFLGPVGKDQIGPVAVKRPNLPPRRQQPQLRQLQHPFGREGDRAEAVLQFQAEISQRLQVAQAGQAAINLDSRLLPRHVVARQECR